VEDDEQDSAEDSADEEDIAVTHAGVSAVKPVNTSSAEDATNTKKRKRNINQQTEESWDDI
jgi:hypothetical protein